MLFNSWPFVGFLIALLALTAPLARYGTAWRVIVLAASYFFYAHWNVNYLALIAASTLVDYWLALKIGTSRHPKLFVSLSVAANLGFLGFFKYTNFLIESANAGLRAAHAPFSVTPLDIVLPVGISFFTFQAMSYTIDVYRREIAPRRNLLDYALFIAFFPQLLAGPIVRAKEFFVQLDHPSPLANRNVQFALVLVSFGLVKKMVFADSIAEAIDPTWNNVAAASAWTMLAAIYGFALQIYFDFSGYTDVAIGVALLLGFRFPKNFDYPYLALSVQDFWRRWHMTLSRWLRDYLYISLGGNRRGRARTYANLMITMLLGGLWHGASWNFVVWGGLHGLYLAAERALGLEAAPASAPGKALRWFITFHLVCLSWIFFRSADFATSLAVLRKLAGLVTGPVMWADARALIGLLALVLAWQTVARGARLKQRLADASAPAIATTTVACVLAIAWLTPARVVPFIYFQF